MSETSSRWDLRITKGDNGFRCNWLEDVDDGGILIRESVFEEEERDTGELDCMVRLLYFVAEHFGVIYSKHNKHNLVIKREDMDS